MRVKHVLNKEVENVLFVFERVKKKYVKMKEEKGIIIIRRNMHANSP